MNQIMIEENITNNSDGNKKHVSVMLAEVVENLNVKENGIYIDCTLGMGGHAEEILRKMGPLGRLIGIDKDEKALSLAKQNLSKYTEQCSFIHDDFRNIDKILKQLNIEKVDGILLDIGVSSMQLDETQRGFSLRADAPLDMRMDLDNPISAYDLVNSLSENEISMILRDFGEERYHNRIAHLIISERMKKPIETTKELRHIVMKAMPFGRKHQKIHPATRTFQAIRIAVNRELESLEIALDKCVEAIKISGRLIVISFHSLEDRIVKHKFRDFQKQGKVNILTKKPLRPTEQEELRNPRSRSAKLRIVERI